MIDPKNIKSDFNWVKKVLLDKNNKCIHYDSLKRLVENFSNKWIHIKSENPDLYWVYVNYLTLKLRFEFNEE